MLTTSNHIIFAVLFFLATLVPLSGCDEATPLEHSVDALAPRLDQLLPRDVGLPPDLQLDMELDQRLAEDAQAIADGRIGDQSLPDAAERRQDGRVLDGDFGTITSHDMGIDLGSDDPNAERTARRWAEAYCGYIRPCATGVMKVAAWADGDCVEQVYLSIRDGELARLQYGLAAGLIELEPDSITRCINAYANLDCAAEDQLANRRQLDAACKETVHGRLGDGQPCVDDTHCSSTLCLGASTCSGICSPRSGLGQPCSDACIGQCECEPNLICDQGLCRRPQQVGTACNRESVCEGAPVFATCTGDGDVDGQCETRPLPEIPAVGGRCGPARLGEPSCHIDHHCVYRPEAGTDRGRCELEFEGPGCPLAFPDMCPDNTYCTDVVPRRGARSPIYMGRCQPRASDGEPCWAIGMRAITPESNCQRGLLCLNDRGRAVGRFGPDNEIGQCTARRALGTQCSADSQCASRRCMGAVCVVPLDCPQLD
ncbi:MAG: hypothetical protein VYA30_15095 [Myxococcota bacterium]|nr:hypothetical protein [Myxococcota bacterium]